MSKSVLRQRLDALIDVIDDAVDLPPTVEGAVNDLLDAYEADDATPWWKKPFYKNGEFSKTAMFVSAANTIALAWFAASPFAGASLDLGVTTLTLQPLDAQLVLSITTVFNGAYLVNNNIKAKSGS